MTKATQRNRSMYMPRLWHTTPHFCFYAMQTPACPPPLLPQDLNDLCEQTAGTGINIYTHGELLPAHGEAPNSSQSVRSDLWQPRHSSCQLNTDGHAFSGPS